MAQMPTGAVVKPVNNNSCIFAHYSNPARRAADARRTFRTACGLFAKVCWSVRGSRKKSAEPFRIEGLGLQG